MSQPEKNLSGQVVVVTGGASGIGRATCRDLAQRGASICVADFNQKTLDETMTELESEWPGTEVIAQRVDVREEEQVQALFDRAQQIFGRVDALVHSAGILRGAGGTPRMLHDTSVEEFDAVVGTNLRGTFLCNRAVLPIMIKQRGGQIINIASTSGIQGRPFDSVYCASKFGVVGLTESVRAEVGNLGIKVHVILPDAVATPLWDQNGPVNAPDYALAPDRVADLITYVLGLPPDVVLGNLIVSPMRSRRRRRGAKKTEAEETS